MAGRDTRTRFQGVFARHRKSCAGDERTACDCTPSYYGKVYDRHTHRYRSTRRFPTVAAARAARKELVRQVDAGELPHEAQITVKDACERFCDAIREGRALNKHGRRYRPTAVKDIDQCLTVHILTRPKLARRRLGDLRRKDVQQLVDELSPTMSGSRVRSIVNALRSLYRWAQDRELVDHDPAALVRLPAMNATPRDRVATPHEMRQLLAALPLKDALPYALAVYAMGRRAQIQRLTWADVDLDAGLVAWGTDEGARKTKAAQRVVPAVQPLRVLLKRAWLEQGKPDPSAKVCPPRKRSASGMIETGTLHKRAIEKWEACDPPLTPIGLHECRHTAATWLDHAGVSPKVASVLMGHTTPEHQPGAAHITLQRYTHVLPEAFEQARQTLDAWIVAEVRRLEDTGT